MEAKDFLPRGAPAEKPVLVTLTAKQCAALAGIALNLSTNNHFTHDDCATFRGAAHALDDALCAALNVPKRVTQ